MFISYSFCFLFANNLKYCRASKVSLINLDQNVEHWKGRIRLINWYQEKCTFADGLLESQYGVVWISTGKLLKIISFKLVNLSNVICNENQPVTGYGIDVFGPEFRSFKSWKNIWYHTIKTWKICYHGMVFIPSTSGKEEFPFEQLWTAFYTFVSFWWLFIFWCPFGNFWKSPKVD